MRITQWGEYGVHFAVYLAARTEEGAAVVGAAEIAQAQGIALHYTQQILLRLREGGIIESVRGPGGGYRLSRAAEAITLLDLLMAAEGDTLELICESKPLSPVRCSPNATCSLRPVWYGLREHVNGYLESITLRSLLETLSAGRGATDLPSGATVQLGRRPVLAAGDPSPGDSGPLKSAS